MNEHEKRRMDDDPVYQIFKNWQFYGSVAMALVAVGGFIATAKIMGNVVSRTEEFQTAQLSINARLTTLIETHDHRIQDLEGWRNDMDFWNRKRH